MCLAIPGQIIEILEEPVNLAVVEVGGVRRKVDVALLHDDPARPGDWILVHVGFALNKISEEDARNQMEIIALLGENDSIAEETEGNGLNEEAR